MRPDADADEARFSGRVQAFLALHRGRPLVDFVPNLDVRVDSLDTEAGPLPVTIHDGGRGQAWVCSPRTTYADCAAEEAARYLPPALTPLAAPALAPLGRLLEWSGLDRNVAINNWLVSTNFYPALRGRDPARLIAAAVERWPGHAIWSAHGSPPPAARAWSTATPTAAGSCSTCTSARATPDRPKCSWDCTWKAGVPRPGRSGCWPGHC